MDEKVKKLCNQYSQVEDRSGKPAYEKPEHTVAELEEMIQKMKPECDVCRITKEIRTPAILKEDPNQGFYEMYYGVDEAIDPIRSQIRYCPACGKKL